MALRSDSAYTGIKFSHFHQLTITISCLHEHMCKCINPDIHSKNSTFKHRFPGTGNKTEANISWNFLHSKTRWSCTCPYPVTSSRVCCWPSALKYSTASGKVVVRIMAITWRWRDNVIGETVHILELDFFQGSWDKCILTTFCDYSVYMLQVFFLFLLVLFFLKPKLLSH